MDPIILPAKYGVKTITVEQDADGNWQARSVYRFQSGELGGKPLAGKKLTQQSKPYRHQWRAIKAAQDMAAHTKVA